MDCCYLVKVFSKTLDINQHEEAEITLSQICMGRGFTPTLLQCSILPLSTLDVQLACAVFLKNMIQFYWDPHFNPGHPVAFRIPEEDKEIIKSNIFDALLSSSKVIRTQLSLCMRYIISNDTDWLPDVVNMINYILQKGDKHQWMVGASCVSELIISIESKTEVRSQFIEGLTSLLPTLCDICAYILHDYSQVSLLLQKRIICTFFSVVKSTCVMKLSSKEVSHMLDLVFAIANRPIPEEDQMVEYGMKLIRSSKECALHILRILFERYSCQNHTNDYVQKFFLSILDVFFKVFSDFTTETCTSPVLLQHTIHCINEGIKHPYFSQLVHPHMLSIIEKILLKILSAAPCDELWMSNHSEFLRLKYDGESDEDIALIMASESLIVESCSKWTEIFKKTVQMAVEILKSPFQDPMTKNGALCIITLLNTVNMPELNNEMDIREQNEQMIDIEPAKPKKPSDVIKNSTRNKRRRALKKNENKQDMWCSKSIPNVDEIKKFLQDYQCEEVDSDDGDMIVDGLLNCDFCGNNILDKLKHRPVSAMGFTSPLGNLKGFATSCPPLMIFTICLTAFALTTLSLAYFIRNSDVRLGIQDDPVK